jgi:hypothetical protein
MIDLIKSIATWEYWNAILSVLVIVHLVSEYWHYAWEYITGRREAKILEDIHNHRKLSTKTKKLQQIQRDLDLIKKHLGISNQI